MSAPLVSELAIADPAVRAELLAFLAPHELQALFLIGNLQRNMPGSQLFGVRAGGCLPGVAGYYDGGRSLVPFVPAETLAQAPAVPAALAVYAAERFRPLDWLVGPAASTRPLLAALATHGFRLTNDPAHVFMECAVLPPRRPHQDRVRPLAPGDDEPVLHLLRWLQAGHDDGRPIERRERNDLTLNPERVVLEIDGDLVATAATNGRGLEAFQVLGVVTHPEHRGRGYAGAAVAALMARMFAQGARRCALFTAHENAPAIRCCEKLGFRITGDFLLAKLAPLNG